MSTNLIGLLQGIEEGLQASKVSNQLENPQDPHYPHLAHRQMLVSDYQSHQSDHLARLPNDLKVLQPLQDEGDVEGADCHKVDYVHCISYEPSFSDKWQLKWLKILW